jgi:ribonuclease HI
MLSRTYVIDWGQCTTTMASTMITDVQLVAAGACGKDPHGQFRSGWGCVLSYGITKKRLQGDTPQTSEVRLELIGIVRGLKHLRRPCLVTVYTSSEYIFNHGPKLIHRNIGCGMDHIIYDVPAKNGDLWREFVHLTRLNNVAMRIITDAVGRRDRARASRAAYDALSNGAKQEYLTLPPGSVWDTTSHW